MYKLVLCWRYLRTRYIALASIISVTLGVATMIVVNSVMSGFTAEMQDRIHGILSDLVVESRTLDGMPDAEWQMERIRRVAGDAIEGMTPTVVVPAMLSFRYGGEWQTRQVHVIGIDELTQSEVSEFAHYLQHPDNRVPAGMSFELRSGGYDTRDHQAGDEDAPIRAQMADAGWTHRRRVARIREFQRQFERGKGEPAELPDEGFEEPSSGARVPGPPTTERIAPPAGNEDPRPPRAGNADLRPPPGLLEDDGQPSGQVGDGRAERAGDGPAATDPLVDPFTVRGPDPAEFDPMVDQHTGTVVGIGLVSYRTPDAEDRFLLLPGDDMQLTFPTAGTPPKPISDKFTIVDLYESKMSEYDTSFVFVPIRQLQELRGMIDPSTGVGNVSSIQIKTRPGVDPAEVRDRLLASGAFPPELYVVQTWRDKQGALLAAVEMETAILNVLLFLIIAVAGFGILAIFLMIVVEKTRDIGIMKSLGASRRGVAGIFVGYGLSLGLVGSGVGTVLGLIFVKNINGIAQFLGWLTGRQVFDPSIYYFYQIPAIVNPFTVAWIVGGAMTIAVLASVLPALRAAMLHPVEALRYE